MVVIAVAVVVVIVVMAVMVVVVDQSSFMADNGVENSFVENRVGAGHDVCVPARDAHGVCVRARACQYLSA